MRPMWIMAGLAGVIAAPALAQTKIPPSHLYSSEPPAPLDKNYGMPPMPGPDLPQKATAAKPKNESESFTANVHRRQTRRTAVRCTEFLPGITRRGFVRLADFRRTQLLPGDAGQRFAQGGEGAIGLFDDGHTTVHDNK